MPISCPVIPRPISQAEFSRIDYQVMRLAFESQNALGRLCDELIYQNDLAHRMEAAGLELVRKGIPLIATHRDFAKRYSMDLVLGDAIVYELKTAVRLVGEHDAQLLNYLLLWGARHGKLINFRPGQVQSRFVNTTLSPETRRQFEVDCHRWRGENEVDEFLRVTFLALLEDWGLFLEVSLYLEALTHFLGGEEKVLRPVPLQRDGVLLGNQRMHLLTPEASFRLTAISGNVEQ